ncbi:Crp/Fnr family transcriptional regulator [Sphingomonas montana]|uniref:Crp/Fnr family transcriptional regulator n=1 Tax=Sphingomonas montana TaxID=1843236 RepID=UPI00096D8455|nr:Crp/Fnr family transcriptional regulator [Sphingomonas montana]
MPLIRRLDTCFDLSQADRAALERLAGFPARDIEPRRDLAREGDTPHHIRLLVDGWACRYKTTPDGHRQIVGFILPGDFCDFSGHLLSRMDHSIGAITRLRVAQIAPETLDALVVDHPGIGRALWRRELVSASIQREWLLSLGQRSAYERLGHLLVELFCRLRTTGVVNHDHCAFPLTQNDLADATGLTSVHVNRTLREFRLQGLVELDRRILRLPDLDGLMKVSGFNSAYLHVDEEGPVDAYV